MAGTTKELAARADKNVCATLRFTPKKFATLAQFLRFAIRRSARSGKSAAGRVLLELRSKQCP
jgi:hypothetical protein